MRLLLARAAERYLTGIKAAIPQASHLQAPDFKLV
jgi:hypothetical protein